MYKRQADAKSEREEKLGERRERPVAQRRHGREGKRWPPAAAIACIGRWRGERGKSGDDAKGGGDDGRCDVVERGCERLAQRGEQGGGCTVRMGRRRAAKSGAKRGGGGG